MSKSQTSKNNWFAWLAAGSVGLAALGLAAMVPVAKAFAQDRAAIIADAANKNSIDPETGYQIAIKLDPKNAGYAVELATRYLERWRADSAFEVLRNRDGNDAVLTRSHAQIELGRGQGQIENTDSESKALQQAIWLAVNGRGLEANQLKAKILSTAGERSLTRIQGGGTALASELLANHMPQAALRVLETAPERSVSRFTALGALYLTAPDNKHDNVNKAAQAAANALSIDPSSLDAHELKRRVLLAQGQRDGANQEKQIIENLRSGRF